MIVGIQAVLCRVHRVRHQDRNVVALPRPRRLYVDVMAAAGRVVLRRSGVPAAGRAGVARPVELVVLGHLHPAAHGVVGVEPQGVFVVVQAEVVVRRLQGRLALDFSR